MPVVGGRPVDALAVEALALGRLALGALADELAGEPMSTSAADVAAPISGADAIEDGDAGGEAGVDGTPVEIMPALAELAAGRGWAVSRAPAK
jgi:hypothetical protein